MAAAAWGTRLAVGGQGQHAVRRPVNNDIERMRNIPAVTKNLLIINVVCYLFTIVAGDALANLFGLHFFLAPDFQVYQLFTYMFLHGGFTHLLFNMFALWMFGCVVENQFGARKFALFYLACGVGAGLFQEGAQMVQFWMRVNDYAPGTGLGDLFSYAGQPGIGQALNSWTTVGASGAIYGILLAFGMTFPEERIFIIPIPFPIKAKWFVMGYAAIEVASAMATPGDGVAHLAHLGGMAVGFFIIRYWRRHPGGRGGSSWHTPSGGGFFKFRRGGSEAGGRRKQESSPTGNPDWDYNARRKANQAETDRILDKIRRSGYDSLTAAEKKHLFDNSRK